MYEYKNMQQKLRPLIILGAGRHAISVANVAMSAGYDIALFIDQNKKGSSLLGMKIIGDISEVINNLEFDYSIAIGDNFLRERIFNELPKCYSNLRFPSLVHKTAVVSHFSKIGDGVVVMPNAIVGPNSVVGKFCLINTQASIDHDCVMSDFSSLAPGAVTGGNVTIGQRSAISIGAVVKDGVKIGSDSVLGANSYLDKDLGNNYISYGTPARVIRSRETGDVYL